MYSKLLKPFKQDQERFMSWWIYDTGATFLGFSTCSAVEEEKCVLFLRVKLKPSHTETLFASEPANTHCKLP